jgi:hypothetical protein
MMTNNLDIKKFMEKVKSAEKGHTLDLSSGEDLSIAVMNLISLEEHMLFNGNKTGKTKYFDMLNEVREMRKDLMKQLVKDPEGEVWCTSKHLLAASMRLFEVGTKAQTKGDTKSAYDMFKKSFNLYNLFWGIILGLVDKKDMSPLSRGDARRAEGLSPKELPLDIKKSDLLGKVSGVIGKILDCCRE